jgi:hypothetical protein
MSSAAAEIVREFVAHMVQALGLPAVGNRVRGMQRLRLAEVADVEEGAVVLRGNGALKL